MFLLRDAGPSFSDSYHARWVSIDMIDGPVHAITFVVNPHQSRYAGVGRLRYQRIARSTERVDACGEIDRVAGYAELRRDTA